MTLVEKHLRRLTGQTAWITGGKRIGRAVARALAEQGVNLVLSYNRSARAAEDTAIEARELGVRAMTVAADVSSRQSVKEAVEKVRGDFPRIHILVNLASVYQPVAIDEIGEHDWKENVGAHILGTFWPTQFIVPLMPRGGHVINVADASVEGRPQKRNLPYIATKATVAAMTRAMALEYGERGIFVNAVAPGPIQPPEDFPRETWERIRERSPVKFQVTDTEAVDQFVLLVLYLSATTMSSGHVYALDQGQNLG